MKQSEAVVEIPIGKLDRHPDNPRKAKAYSKAALSSLKDVLDEHGAEPCVVRPLEGGRFEILSGHRRAAALELNGAKTVPCVVREKDDVEALTFLLSVNDQHEPTDPFLEARAIGKLLNKHGSTLDAVAKKLGWSVRRVARRRELLNLCPTILEEYQREGSEVSRWPVTWLEAVVQLDANVQERWFKEQNPVWLKTLQQIEDSISGYLRHLGDAPWDLHDVTLVPKAGACSTCPKQSAGAPGLFGDGATPDKLNKATCRDAICWKSKLDKHAAVAVAKALESNEDLVPLKSYAGGQPGAGLSRPHARLPKGKSALQGHMWNKCAKDDPGAKQGILVDGPSAGRKQWFKPMSHATSNGRVTETRDLKKELADAEAAYERAVAGHFLNAVNERVGGAKVPPAPEHFFPLLAVVGFEASEWETIEQDWAAAAAITPAEEKSAFLWPSVRGGVVDRCTRTWGATPAQMRVFGRLVLGCFLDASAIDTVLERCASEVPVPPQLLELRKRAAEAKGAKKKRGAAAEPDAKGDAPATPGTCRQCGCTETTPCVTDEGPCAWCNAERTLCTACDIKNEEGMEALVAAAKKRGRKPKKDRMAARFDAAAKVASEDIDPMAGGAMCACGHRQGFHKDGTGACNEELCSETDSCHKFERVD